MEKILIDVVDWQMDLTYNKIASLKLISVKLRSTGHNNDVSNISVPMRTKQKTAKRR